MADDLYSILGLPRAASEDDVRRAYLKLVKELHPDINPSAAATERFKRVTAAHDILGDPNRRRQYDRGEINGNGEANRNPFRNHAGAGAGMGGGTRGGFGNFNSEDIFSDIFSGLRGGARTPPGPMRGQDQRYTLEVDLTEAAEGAKKRVTLPGGGVLDLNVPEGVGDGQTLRLKGKGGVGLRGGEAGDALVEIKIRPHAIFKRNGDDLLIDLPVTLDEAVLGARVEIPAIGGRVQIQIPRSTSSGRVLRLKGKGIKNAATGAQGDQLVTIKIVLPIDIDDELSEFMKAWRDKNKYDPGRV